MSMDDFDDEVVVAAPQKAAAKAKAAPPLHWPSIEEDIDDARAELTCWVEQLVDRFDIPSNVVPNCWNRHNNQVEALQALRDFERAGYDKGAAPDRGVDFMKAMVDILDMTSGWCASTGCADSHSENLIPRVWSTDPAGWDDGDREPTTWHVISA